MRGTKGDKQEQSEEYRRFEDATRHILTVKKADIADKSHTVTKKRKKPDVQEGNDSLDKTA